MSSIDFQYRAESTVCRSLDTADPYALHLTQDYGALFPRSTTVLGRSVARNSLGEIGLLLDGDFSSIMLVFDEVTGEHLRDFSVSQFFGLTFACVVTPDSSEDFAVLNGQTLIRYDKTTGAAEWTTVDSGNTLAANSTHLFTATPSKLTRYDPATGIADWTASAAVVQMAVNDSFVYTLSTSFGGGVIEERSLVDGSLVRSWSTNHPVSIAVRWISIDGDKLFCITGGLGVGAFYYTERHDIPSGSFDWEYGSGPNSDFAQVGVLGDGSDGCWMWGSSYQYAQLRKLSDAGTLDFSRYISGQGLQETIFQLILDGQGRAVFAHSLVSTNDSLSPITMRQDLVTGADWWIGKHGY